MWRMTSSSQRSMAVCPSLFCLSVLAPRSSIISTTSRCLVRTACMRTVIPRSSDALGSALAWRTMVAMAVMLKCTAKPNAVFPEPSTCFNTTLAGAATAFQGCSPRKRIASSSKAVGLSPRNSTLALGAAFLLAATPPAAALAFADTCCLPAAAGVFLAVAVTFWAIPAEVDALDFALGFAGLLLSSPSTSLGNLGGTRTG
mmetsp:Transcript_80742/g.231963  ORF Transcript_80742/g.231963 Transcript_80742/m.231963 type:complete len:201 (+) Transcript_80742:418-1020(+)